jgi:hypothetical protein
MASDNQPHIPKRVKLSVGRLLSPPDTGSDCGFMLVLSTFHPLRKDNRRALTLIGIIPKRGKRSRVLISPEF